MFYYVPSSRAVNDVPRGYGVVVETVVVATSIAFHVNLNPFREYCSFEWKCMYNLLLVVCIGYG